MNKILITLFLAIIINGCVSTKVSEIYTTEKIKTEKIIALIGQRQAWMSQFEIRLRKNGYEIKRFASIRDVTERINETTEESYPEFEVNAILVIDAYASNTSMTRCYGGGFNFKYINTEIIDPKKNETLATYSNSGYSENCPPSSGTIFTDVINQLNSVFED